MNIKKLTPFEDINNILIPFAKSLDKILGKQLVGVYLTGSLTYGGFDRGSSDIDFLVVLTIPLDPKKLKEVQNEHFQLGKDFPVWKKRIEGSYITQAMLSNSQPPEQPRPYVNAGKMWSFVYGYEWILNLFALYENGISIVGPDPKDIFKPVSIENVRKASRNNLLQEWQPKLIKPNPFISKDYDTNHLQAYAVLTMCRILYTSKNEGVASKPIAASWSKNAYGKEWIDLISKAEKWQHGQRMNAVEKVKEFIRFTIQETS